MTALTGGGFFYGDIMHSKTLSINERLVTVFDDGKIFREPFTDSIGRFRVGTFLKQDISKKGYARVCLRVSGEVIRMSVHRVVAKAFLDDYSEDLQVDHIDGNTINNHISNLRMLTGSENSRAHRDVNKNSSSKYRGVFWDKEKGKWRSAIGLSGDKFYLGSYNNERDAAIAYNNKAIELGFFKESLNSI